MSTLSTNQIVVEYIIKEGDIQKAQQNFDKLTEAEKRAILETKNLNAEIKNVGTSSERAFTSALTPLKNSSDAVRSFTTNLRTAAQAAVEAGNKASAGFTGITASEKKAEAGAKAFNDKLVQLNTTLTTTGRQGKDATDKVSTGLRKVGENADGIGPMIKRAFALTAVIEFTKKIFTTSAAFEGLRTTIDYATQGQQENGKAFQYLIGLANTYGKDLQSLAGTYSSFTASSNLAGIKLEESNKIFEAAVKASTALGKSNEDTQGILLAFSQIVSKGTVQAEELRGQIGERIPGAFNLAAKAMGVTTKELNKMLEQGQVISAEFLPKFAVELENAFGDAANKKMSSLTATLGRFTTAWSRFLESPAISKYLAETVNLATVSLDKVRQLTLSEGEKKAEAEAKIESNITTNLKNELEARLKEIQDKTNKNATMDQVVMQKYVETLAFQSKYETDVTNQKIITANSWNKVALTTAQNNLKNTNIVLAALEKEIKGYEINEKKKIELTEKEKKAIEDAAKKRKKALEDEYQRKVELLELDKQITAEKIKQTVGADQQKIAMMELEFATNLKILKVSKQYADLEVKQAKDKAKILPEIIKTQNVQIAQEYIDAGIKEREIRVKGEDEVQQGIYDAKLKTIERNKMIQEAAIESETYTGLRREKEAFMRSEKLIQNEILANEQIMAANDEAANNGVESALDANAKILADNAKLYRELAELRKKDAEDQNKLNIERVQAVAQVASAVLDGFINLQQQQTQKELAALNSKYESEIRLAGDNEQKVMELNEKRRQEEKQLRIKEFEAQRAAAIAQVVFKTAPIIAEYLTTGFLAPLAIAGLAIAAAQIGFIAAQPTPEFKEGTKGKPFKGGKAIVGEIGKEWVVTTSGQVYETPGVATLVDLPKGSQVIPHNEVIRAERYMGSKLMREGRGDGATGQVVERLMSIENTLSKLPITSLTMDERGFTKKIQTKSRETRILNNRFGN
jgi:tape measure domain-containing protein